MTSARLNGRNGFISLVGPVGLGFGTGLAVGYDLGYWLVLGFGLGFGSEIRAQGHEK